MLKFWIDEGARLLHIEKRVNDQVSKKVNYKQVHREPLIQKNPVKRKKPASCGTSLW